MTTLTFGIALVVAVAVTAAVTWALTRAHFAAQAARLEATLAAATDKTSALERSDERMRETFRALSQDAAAGELQTQDPQSDRDEPC